ncbi:unnamed protein product, partial [Prorocentrum cordatum]
RFAALELRARSTQAQGAGAVTPVAVAVALAGMVLVAEAAVVIAGLAAASEARCPRGIAAVEGIVVKVEVRVLATSKLVELAKYTDGSANELGQEGIAPAFEVNYLGAEDPCDIAEMERAFIDLDGDSWLQADEVFSDAVIHVARWRYAALPCKGYKVLTEPRAGPPADDEARSRSPRREASTGARGSRDGGDRGDASDSVGAGGGTSTRAAAPGARERDLRGKLGAPLWTALRARPIEQAARRPRPLLWSAQPSSRLPSAPTPTSLVETRAATAGAKALGRDRSGSLQEKLAGKVHGCRSSSGGSSGPHVTGARLSARDRAKRAVERKPGKIAQRAMAKMRRYLQGNNAVVDDADLALLAFVTHFASEFTPSTKSTLPARNDQEVRALAAAVDCVPRGDLARATGALVRQFKSAGQLHYYRDEQADTRMQRLQQQATECGSRIRRSEFASALAAQRARSAA